MNSYKFSFLIEVDFSYTIEARDITEARMIAMSRIQNPRGDPSFHETAEEALNECILETISFDPAVEDETGRIEYVVPPASAEWVRKT